MRPSCQAGSPPREPLTGGGPNRERPVNNTDAASRNRGPVVAPAVTSIELDRRSVLVAGAATTGAVALGVSLTGDADAAEGSSNRYFRHGVASGDPHPTSVILWTRVTPTPDAAPGSGKGPRVAVRWQVAKDRRFSDIVAKGSFTTT